MLLLLTSVYSLTDVSMIFLMEMHVKGDKLKLSNASCLL